MNRLLLVEPDKMLRHAFMVALYPEFQIQAVASIPETSPRDVNALIVDAAALQEREPESARKIHVLAHWRVPIIWVGGDETAQTPQGDRSMHLKRPVSKEALRHALAQCLNAEAAPKSNNTESTATRKTARPRQRNDHKALGSVLAEGDNVIELVDVVEEEAAR